MNYQGLRWNVHCVANVALRIRLNLYKRGFKIYDLLVSSSACSSLSKAPGFLETFFMSQWMLLAFIPAFHRRKALLQYARHPGKEFHLTNPSIATHFVKEMLILREFFPIQCKRLSANTRNSNGHESGSCFCQYCYYKNRTSYLEAKHK